MTDTPATDVLDTDGPAAPPRLNGELVFEAPWESRLFGMTLSLHESGQFEWEDFRKLLIDEIQTWERAGHSDAEWNYYERWATALERLLTAKGLCRSDELAERTRAFAERPHGHDH